MDRLKRKLEFVKNNRYVLDADGHKLEVMNIREINGKYILKVWKIYSNILTHIDLDSLSFNRNGELYSRRSIARINPNDEHIYSKKSRRKRSEIDNNSDEVRFTKEELLEALKNMEE